MFDPLIAMHARGELAAMFPASPAVTVHILPDANHGAFATQAGQVAPLIG